MGKIALFFSILLSSSLLMADTLVTCTNVENNSLYVDDFTVKVIVSPTIVMPEQAKVYNDFEDVWDKCDRVVLGQKQTYAVCGDTKIVLNKKKIKIDGESYECQRQRVSSRAAE